jgi:hypothetical protein
MSLHRCFTMVMVMIALPFAATPASARGSHARAVRTPEDDAQMRELLGKLAAASGQSAPEERTDADLMYEAMLRWNGEPADSVAVDRLIESSKKEAARSKRATVEKVRSMFWKDPFANDPKRLIPVRQEDRDLLDGYEQRVQRRAEVRTGRTGHESEVSRLRAEVEAAREDAAAARAENARLRQLEQASSAESDRRECVADNDARAEVRKRRRSGGGPSRSHRHAEQMLTQVAMVSPATSVQSYQPSPPPPPVSTPIPEHGIIVVPLPSPPQPVVAEKGRRAPSSRSAR